MPAPVLRTLRFTVAYEGTRYVGWQRQAEGETVQGVLEAAFAALASAPVVVHGAGRTDAGVHARGQVAHVRAALPVPVDRLPYALNAHLPPDIVVLEAREADEGFHARFSALGKRYGYTLRVHPFPHPLDRDFVWRVDPPLDVAAMQAAAAQLVGCHDFTSFATHADDGPDDRVRTLTRLDVRPFGDYLEILAEADGFLRNMVRSLVGTLVEVGRGRLAATEVLAILAARDRRRAPATAPAHGLCLLEGRYPGDG